LIFFAIQISSNSVSDKSELAPKVKLIVLNAS
jgi:hypothetical protein